MSPKFIVTRLLESNTSAYTILLEVLDSVANIQRFTQKYGDVKDDEIKAIFDKFNKYVARLKQKDIFAYSSLEELNSVLSSMEATPSKSQQIKATSADAPKVYEDDQVVVVKPLTHKAVMKYGAGTKWCITEKDGSHYKDYVKKGVEFYFILAKNKPSNDPNYKVAVAVIKTGDIEVFDAKDDNLGTKIPYDIPKSVFKWCGDYKLTIEDCIEGTYTLNADGSYDVDGYVKLENLNLTKLPFKFGRVSGDFDCSNNKLTSLAGAPSSVGGYFNCSNNQLTSLVGAPKSVVGGGFYCNYNQLTNLEGAPSNVGGSFYCSDNKLTSLTGAPKSVGGDFYCYANKLTNLDGAPSSVGGYFDCSSNQLTSLVGAPKSVGGCFKCSDNQLTSLTGAPSSVGGYFYCSDNQLTSLTGAPSSVGGNFYCSDNKLTSLEGLGKVKGNVYSDFSKHW